MNRGCKGRDMTGSANPMFGRRRPDLAERNKKNAGRSYSELYGARSDTIKTKVLRGLMRAPNAAEKLLASMMPPNVEYTGDGKFWIKLLSGKHKNPDFVVRPFRTTKKVIELFGEHWHPSEEEPDLVASYERVGVKCLVLWCAALRNKAATILRVSEFCK